MLWRQLADSGKVVFHRLQLAEQLRVSPFGWEGSGTTPRLGEEGVAMATHTRPWSVGDWTPAFGEPSLRVPGHL